MAQKETAAKNKRIQKLIAPKLQADPIGLNQAKWKLPPNSKRGQEMNCAKKGGSKRHGIKIVRSPIGG